METNLNKKTIRDAILDYCEAKEISHSELATKADVSAATISNIINDKWENIATRLWRKLENVVCNDHLNDLLKTRDYKAVFTICDTAKKLKRMVGLIADTGMGKTTALTAYAAQPNIYYYYVDATVTPRVFLKGLLQDMGVKFEGSLNEMVQKVTTELNTTEAPLLILDESAKLNDKMLLILHSIRDKTFKNCGIVLAGMPDFKTQLFKKANKRKTGYSEFLRRVNVWEELQGLTTSERNGVLKHYGITDEGEQKKFRKTQRFGDLKNEIDLYLFEQSTTN